MFKISFYIKKKENINIDEFRAYWLGEHAKLQKNYLEKIGVRCYQKCEILPENPLGIASVETYQTRSIHYDFIDHMYFNDIEALKKGVTLPEVHQAMQKLYQSEDMYVDIQQSNVLMNVDIAQFYPVDAEDVRATFDNDYVRIHYCVRAFPKLTRQMAQLHWNTCHGAVSRQDIKYSALKKYLQAHAIDSTFVNELVKLRGYEVDSTFIGHAEAWISQVSPSPDYPEEEAAEVAAMSLDDIDLFADKSRSQVFVTKDHFIIDKKIIVRPMPSFFGAVY